MSLLPGGQVWVFTRAAISRGKSRQLAAFILLALQISLTRRQNREYLLLLGLLFSESSVKHLCSRLFRWIVLFHFLPTYFLPGAGRFTAEIKLSCLEISGSNLPSSTHMVVSLWLTHRFQIKPLSISCLF